jgi:hypothetical protein
MTTRRDFLIIAGGALAAGAAAGCRRAGGAVAAAVPDVLVADSRAGLVLLGGTRRTGLGPAAAVRPDGGLIYAVTDGATLVRVDPADGVPARSGALGGGWVPRAVSADGRACVLGRAGASARPAARARTELLVSADGRHRTYDLPGVVEPDAFTTDGTGLFVLEWFPAGAPDRYRVRLLDLATGRTEPLLTRTKTAVPAGAEEEMRGDGRSAVLSPDGRVLYTLYTHQAGHRHTRDLLAARPGGVHAFVHVLHLTERWAYCLDLPHPFGEGAAEGHAVAVSPDGSRLAVADVTSGSLAYADTGSLTIEQVVPLPAAPGAAGLAFGRQLYAGVGDTVVAMDGATVAARWGVPGAVRGLGVSRDGNRVHAGVTDAVVWLDAADGRLLGRVAVDGLVALRHVR